MVDVTTEALQTVKSALATFQSDISGISMRATNNADEITEECKNHLKQTKAEIAQVETQIATNKHRSFDTNFGASLLPENPLIQGLSRVLAFFGPFF